MQMVIRIRKLEWGVWWRGLLSSFIMGGATACSSWLGIVAAKAVGINVPTLDLKALGVIFLSGALTNLFSYLRQSPIPPEEEVPMDTVETTIKSVIKTPSETP